MISRALKAIENESFLNEFIPVAEGESQCNMWGTKWDIYNVNIESQTENEIQISFLSAWTAPTVAYHALYKMGFNINALYYECENEFCGQFCVISRNDKDIIIDNQYDTDYKDDIPESLKEFIGSWGDSDDEDEESDDETDDEN
jgi:hypothetical protein